MSLLFWNVRGLGNRRTIRELEKYIRAQDPIALFLAETWVGEARLIDLCSKLGFDHYWVTPQVNRLGCLILYWKNIITIEVMSSSANHIDTVVGVATEESWHLIGIYDFADPAKKQDTWALLRQLHTSPSMPWLCTGDFNEILWPHEKCGLGPRCENQMRDFREVLDEAGLKDLGFVGKKFTWKGQRCGGLVLERLDRAVANNHWLSQNPGTKVQHLHSYSSDHLAIIVKPEGIVPRQNRSFKFEQMWLRDRGCSDTVISAWGLSLMGAKMPEVARKIHTCGEKLSEWSKNNFGSIRKLLEEKKKLLDKAEMAAARGGGDQLAVKSLQMEINSLLDKESQMWQQCSRVLFLKCGDKNTSYFHSKASQRFRRNRILGLKNNMNVWCTEESHIRNIAFEYYQALFSSSAPSDFDEVLSKVQPSVTEDMNSMLLWQFDKEEVEVALKQMASITAPGPDGMPPLFFQSFWSTVDVDVCSAVLDCLQNCKIPTDINRTHIVLIPKIKSPERITEYRLISLCSVIYKLVSNVLANWLKSILLLVISENQSVVQAGRVITNNILMAFETLHWP